MGSLQKTTNFLSDELARYAWMLYTECLIQLGHQDTGIFTEVFVTVYEKVFNFIS